MIVPFPHQTLAFFLVFYYNNSTMKGLGETIKALRVEKGLTQPQLAAMIGVSNGMISIWENNVNEPKASNLKALAAALDVSVDTLLGDD